MCNPTYKLRTEAILENLDFQSSKQIIENEIKLLSTVYQSKTFIPIIKNTEICKLARIAQSSPFGVRGVRVQIHQLLEKQAFNSAIDHLI